VYSIAPNAGHMTTQDNPSHDLQAIKDFFAQIENVL